MESPAVRGDATYLVTGGTGGLGLEAARWLVGEGARHLVLSSRRGAGEPARQQISKLESQGAEVRVVTADVRDEEQMRSVVDAIGSSMPPLRGVIHAAGIYGGTLLAEQDWEGFEEVVDIKVAGSWILHDLTRELPLDFFVCVSSAASVVGAAGRAAYGAANHFKDALCHHRARVGLPATVVNWGPWGEVGMMVAQADRHGKAQTDRYRKALHERGMGLIDPVEGTRVLGALIAEGRTQSAVMQINWLKFFENVSPEYVPPFFERVAPRSVQGAAPAQERKSDLGHLKVAPREEQRGLVDRYLLERVARIVGYPDPDQVDREVTLLELGFDSLMAVQLRNAIRTDLEVDLPVGKLFDTASVESLTELIQEKLAAGASGAQPPAMGAAGDGAHVEVI